MRVFCFADGNYEGKMAGGGKGVTYRLFVANRKYQLIENMYFVFGDTLIEQNTDNIVTFDDSEVLAGGISGLMKFYTLLDEKLRFSSDDVYIFHDFACFYAMKNAVNHIDRTCAVYHGQGSLFHEAAAFGLNPGDEYRSRCNILTEYVLSNAQMVCFPSEGAKEAFISTSDDHIVRILKYCEGRILYNGCSPTVSEDPVIAPDILELIEKKKTTGRIFISVATINEAKGVERLPVFFKDYGKDNDYLWIIVGDGSKSEELSEGIKEIMDHVLWIREPMPNKAIIELYEKADYYILAHRISIFDFATIEAMHMGTVPILTPIGGNKEVICQDNGFFLNNDDIGDSRVFVEWEEKQNIDDLKRANIEIAQAHFSEKSMLEGYESLVNELNDNREKKDLLIIVPDLELNGAQVVLSELLELPYFRGKSIDMISPSKGVYGQKYREKGIHIQIRPYISGDDAFRHHLLNDYKAVFINTSSCNMYLLYFINTDVPVVLWLHETFSQLEKTGRILDPRMYSSNIRLLGVTSDVKYGITKMFGKVDMDILPMPVADVSCEGEPDFSMVSQELLDRVEGKVLFFLPAAYTVIKGQDIVLKAILQLPSEYLHKAHFLFCGYKIPGQEEYYVSLKRICESIPEVTMLDEISRDEVYFWYRVSDCVLAPSRVDATPTSIVEAMMFGKTTLISDATGISKYLNDCISSFVFSSEDMEELKKRLMLIISDYDKLDFIGINGRKVYEDNFSPQHVNDLVESLMN